MSGVADLPDIEAIAAALFEKLEAVPGLVTSSRFLRHWNDVPNELRPALYQAQQSGGTFSRNAGASSMMVVHLPFEVYIYVGPTADGAGTLPATLLNTIQQGVMVALLTDLLHDGRQTLGGLVHDCFIDGEVETDEGTLGEQAVAIIPITAIAYY